MTLRLAKKLERRAPNIRKDFPTTHRWVKPRFRLSLIWRWRYNVPKIEMVDWKCCIYCGMRRYRTRAEPYRGNFGKSYFAKWGDIYREQKHVPICEDMPANYDPPIGA